MTTTRAAVLAALLTVAALALGTPAAAAPQPVQILSVSSDTVRPGETVRVTFRVTNDQNRAERVYVLVSGGLRCTTGCSARPDLRPGQSRTLRATLVAPEVGPGETGLNLAVGMRIGDRNEFDHKQITVRGGGAPAAAEVRRVTGRVRDTAGKPVAGATVTVRDGAGQEHRAETDRSGRFTLRSGDDAPIAAGRLTVTAERDGYRSAQASVQATARRTATVRLTLTAVEPARATVSPSPPPAEEEEAPAAGPAETTAPATVAAAGDAGGTGMLLGGLLIAAGVGALALIVIRRRREDTAPVRAANAPTTVLRGRPADAPTAMLPGRPADAPTAMLPGHPADAPTAVLPGRPAGDAPTAMLPGHPADLPTAVLPAVPRHR